MCFPFVHKSEMVQELMDFGLTSYEAKTYVALASLGPTEPKKVASEAKIPYPSAYTALKDLEEKGWVDKVLNKPVTYRAKRPRAVKAVLASHLDDTFTALEDLYRSEPSDEAELVYTLRGEDKVLGKIYELIRGATRSMVLVSPGIGLGDSKMISLIGDAVVRGVRVRVLGDEEAVGLLPPGVEIRTGNLVAVDLLVDDKVAMIGLPDYSAAGWIDSPAVASHFKQFLDLLWNTSSPA
jgi:HTH-type transcriptional regulator, sugar sensing transcriptional regulator